MYLAVVVPEPFEVSLFGKVSKCTETEMISIFKTYSDFCNFGLLVNISRYFYQMQIAYIFKPADLSSNPFLLNPFNAEVTFIQGIRMQRFFVNHLNPVMLVFIG